MNAPSCSARVLQPFMRFVDARRLDRDLVPQHFWAADADGRVSLAAAQAMLDCGVERLRDERLGLKLGRSMRFGEGGPFDYAVRSAATVRDAIGVAGRYSKLLSDTFEIGFEVWRSRAVIRLNEVTWTRPAGDFAMAAFHRIHLVDEVPAASRLECWFPYGEPQDASEHQRSFGKTTLRFNAPFFAFSFNRAYEKAPMPGADSMLHAVHCARVDWLLGGPAAPAPLKTRVCGLIEQQIRFAGAVRLTAIARALHMSDRSVSRHLEREGTTFADELDSVRRRLALVYVSDRATPLKAVAFQLGFSHAESFHRAFRRWTGETPVAYRKRTER